MELRQLRTLVSVLDHGGFAAAGEVIGLTQSAVSLQIKALESELGYLLFDRSKRPPQPNIKATTFAKQSREILRLCNNLHELTEESLHGSLLLGSVATAQSKMLPEALTILRRKHPMLQIKITTGLSDELTRSVYRGYLDAAIVSEPAKIRTGLNWYPFAAETLVVIAPNSIREKSDVDILQNHPFIRFQRSTWAGQLINTKLRDRGIRVNTILETDSLESVAQLVVRGLGVSVVPHHELDVAFPLGLRIVPFDCKPVQRVVGLIERTSDPKKRLVRVLYKALIKKCETFENDTSHDKNQHN